MSTMRTTTMLLLTSLSLVACVRSRASNGPGSIRSAAAATAVRVANNGWHDVTVYMLRGGNRVRLGTVTSLGSGLFRVPPAIVGSAGGIRLMVDPIGSRQTYTTPDIQVGPGQRIEFTIQNHLPISTVSVSNR